MVNFGELRICVGQPAVLRIHGRLQKLMTKVLQPTDTKALTKSITPEWCQEELQETGSTDFGYAFSDAARFRVSVFRQSDNVSMVLRTTPKDMSSRRE